AARRDPKFADAKVGVLGCMSLLGYILLEDGVALQDHAVMELLAQMKQLRAEVVALDADNPRLMWILGPVLWKTAAERGGGQAKAIDLYNRGLQVIRQRNAIGPRDPLDPNWGEAELLMNLAY